MLVHLDTIHVKYKEVIVHGNHKAPFTRYNLLSNRLDNRLYRVYKHSTGCQTVWQPVWQPGASCIQPFVKAVVNPFWQPVELTNSGCSFNRLYNWFDNRLDVCLHDRPLQPDVKPVWQSVVSCKRGIRKMLRKWSVQHRARTF